MKQSNENEPKSFLDRIKETDTFKEMEKSLDDIKEGYTKNKRKEPTEKALDTDDKTEDIERNTNNEPAIEPSSSVEEEKENDDMDTKQNEEEVYAEETEKEDTKAVPLLVAKETEANPSSEETPEEKENSSFNYGRLLAVVDGIYVWSKRIFLALIIFLFFLGALALGGGIGYFVSLLEPSAIEPRSAMVETVSTTSESSQIYYGSGEFLSDLRTDLKRTSIPIEEVSDYVIQAIMATEDEDFLEHPGIVPKAIIRAGVQQVTGTGSTGGSTITQQIVKQQILSSETTFERKANEMLLAMRLEQEMSKDEIMEVYLNVSPFGRNNRGENIAGIEEAAIGIFGVEPAELTIPQAAFLAGLPNSPILYSPYDQHGNIKSPEDLEPGINRYEDVLFFMFREGFINEEEFQYAMNYDISQDLLPRVESEDAMRSYVYDETEKRVRDIFIEDLARVEGISEEELAADTELYNDFYNRADEEMRYGGYTIHTTIDRDVHQAFEQVIAENRNFLGSPRDVYWSDENGEQQHIVEYPQNGTVLMNNQTGKIYAFIGGSNYEDSNVNHAFQTRRQPGSVLKPTAVYGPALEEGLITPASVMYDTRLEFNTGGSTWVPENATSYTDRWWDARDALSISQNIPALRVYLEMRDHNVSPKSYIRNSGLGPDAITEEDFSALALPLGGVSYGATVEELTAAIAAIANKGVYVEPYFIASITDSDGEVFYEPEQEATRVFSEQTAFLLQDMLRDTLTDGTARSIPSLLDFDADLMGKSGTTDYERDVWFIASSPQVTLGSWMGYTNIIEPLNLTREYGYIPAHRNYRVWAQLMNSLNQVRPEYIAKDQSFTVPEGITEERVLQSTGMKPGRVELPDGSEAFAFGASHTEYFNENNVPGTTTYDFGIGSSDEELRDYWEDRKTTFDLREFFENETDDDTEDDEDSIIDQLIEEFENEEETDEEENSEDSEDSENE